MADPGDWRSRHRRRNPGLRRAWCCSFGVDPQSPDNRRPCGGAGAAPAHRQLPAKHPKHYPGSFHSSPSPSSKIGRGLIDPRRILSPGRVSPIDSDHALVPLPESGDAASVAATNVESEAEEAAPKDIAATAGRFSSASSAVEIGRERAGSGLRLGLKGRDGRSVVLELDPEVLCESSSFFAKMVMDSRRRASDGAVDCRKIEVANIEDLGVFKETIELMFEKDLMKWFMNAGISRAIDVLEVSFTIMFDRGIRACLKYIEAVPWSESEEEKLKTVLLRCKFDDAIVQETLSRLYSQVPTKPENLGLHLIQSVANGKNANSRKEMQSLVNGLLSKSSVYQKDPAGLDKEGLYSVCYSCLNVLIELFEEASSPDSLDRSIPKDAKPLIERVSKEVDSLNWLLEILIEKQMAEDFVALWSNQSELIRLHETASPMIRYELSRVSACIFMAIGRGRLHCRGDMRHRVLSSWFGPMLSDFGWLQRCSKGLDMRMLEEGLGQMLLTLTLKQQQSLFMEWFRFFAGRGTECPNLGRAFQVWWRRSFVRFPEANNC